MVRTIRAKFSRGVFEPLEPATPDCALSPYNTWKRERRLFGNHEVTK